MHLIEERVFTVHDGDFTGVYGIEGDCPCEAVLPLSLWPNVEAVAAWPVHQLMSKLVARGLVIESLWPGDVYSWAKDSPRCVRDRFYSVRNGIDPGINEECKAVLSVCHDACPMALDLWIRSYLFADPKDRWRWRANGVGTPARDRRTEAVGEA